MPLPLTCPPSDSPNLPLLWCSLVLSLVLSLFAGNGRWFRFPRIRQRFALGDLIWSHLLFGRSALGFIKCTALRGSQSQPHISLNEIVREILSLQIGHAEKELGILHALIRGEL